MLFWMVLRVLFHEDGLSPCRMKIASPVLNLESSRLNQLLYLLLYCMINFGFKAFFGNTELM